MTTLDDILKRLQEMPPEQQKKTIDDALKATAHMLFVPNPGPQTDAFLSNADVLFFGGSAGGGKSFLELGWGINEGESGIIFRRERAQTDGLEKEGKRIIGNAASWNGQDLEWTWPNGKSLKLGGIKGPDDWMAHAGRERDYMAFDEGGEFLEMQVASIAAWVRGPPGRRTRVIIGSNPPRSSEGLWLIKWFAPWLDEHFPDKAAPGELRYAVYVTKHGRNEMSWVEGPGTYTIDGEEYIAKSYTFIPASLADNPYRNTPQYRAQLQSLPEPLRSQLLYGDFNVGATDDINQVIPTLWVREAQKRWESNPPAGVPMCAMGVDASGGGNDPMVIARRHDGWFAPLIEIAGKDIPKDRMGTFCAGQVFSYRKNGAIVVIDMGGGYGGGIYEQVKANDASAIGYKGASSSVARTADRQMIFYNKRSETIWRIREALNPDQPGGSPIMLPPDPMLMADLTAPTWEAVSFRGGMAVKVESKEDVCARLGRSTDRGDAVGMCWSAGIKQANVKGGFRNLGQQQMPKVIMGVADRLAKSSFGGWSDREHG